MSEDTWQILVLILLGFITFFIFSLWRAIDSFNNKFFGLFGSKQTISKNIESLASDVRSLRWAILGGPNDYDDTPPDNTPKEFDQTVLYQVSKIREDLMFIRTKITGESIVDLQNDI